MKFCKDCKFFVPSADFSAHRRWPWSKPKLSHNQVKFATCAKSELPPPPDAYYPVTGSTRDNPERLLKYCAAQRNEWGDCGIDAKLFEPMP